MSAGERCDFPDCDQLAVELAANDEVCTSPDYAERWVCKQHRGNPFGDMHIGAAHAAIVTELNRRILGRFTPEPDELSV